MHTILVTSQITDQESVTRISQNLSHLYKSSIENVKLYSIEDMDISAIDECERLIVIHPLVIIHPSFNTILKKLNDKTCIIFHVFGDYVRKSSFYLKTEHLLMGKMVLWIAASESYRILIQKTVRNSEVVTFPFPTNEKEFYFDSERRHLTRENLYLNDEDRLIIYTGRLSPQKNILRLLSDFSKWKAHNPRLHLAIVGNLDHFESPTYFEKHYKPGEYFFELSTLLEKKDSNIIFLSHKNVNQLNDCYNAADLFISYSLYHDEDFGYSPIEALQTGCPCLLTEWCGFKDTLKLADSIGAGIKVNYLAGELNFATPEMNMIEALLKSLPHQRHEASKRIKEACQLKGAIQKILHHPLKKFSGFTDGLAELSLNHLKSAQNADLKLYDYFYSSFWSEK